MALELSLELPKPTASRIFLMEFIKSYGRKDNPTLPPQEVPLKEIKEVVIENDLWFGAGIDWLDFIFKKETLGTLQTNEDKSSVVWNS